MSATALQTEWQSWADRLWDSLTAHFGGGINMMHLEQKFQRSAKEHRCANIQTKTNNIKP
jgi:hypothetical protein